MTLSQIENRSEEILSRMSEIVAHGKFITPTEDEEFERLDTEMKRLTSQKKTLKTYNPETRQNNFKTLEELTPEFRRKAESFALTQFIKTGSLPVELQPLMKQSVRLAQQTSTTTGGGHTIPQGFINEIERAVKEYGGMWDSARVIKTDKGNLTAWGTVNDTNKKAYLIAENSDGTADAEAVVFGTSQFEGYKYTSGVIQVPVELLEDSELFAEEFINILSERIYRGTNEAFSVADGTNKPKGITQSAVYGCSSLNDTAFGYDDFVNLKHAVDPGYRRVGTGTFMFHDSVLKEIEMIKDLQDRPIFNLGNGTILGHKYVINQDLPSFTPGAASANDNKKFVFFGDFKKYIIRQARSMRIVRLSQRFSDLDQVAFAVILRVDGDLINAGTDPVKYLRISGT